MFSGLLLKKKIFFEEKKMFSGLLKNKITMKYI